MCLPSAAAAHVLSSHSQPFSRAHCNTVRFPLLAAAQHVFQFQGHSTSSRANCRSSRLPDCAAAAQMLGVRARPDSKLSRSCDTEVCDVTALVTVERWCCGWCLHASLQAFDTVAKKRYCPHSTNSARVPMTSASLSRGLCIYHIVETVTGGSFGER